MEKIVAKHYIGQLTFKRLFTGSKSERLYPVLRTDHSQEFRIHLKGNSFGEEKSLLPFSGKTVKVFGVADSTRGHWRIVLDGEDACLIIDDKAGYLVATDAMIPDTKMSPSEINNSEEAS